MTSKLTVLLLLLLTAISTVNAFTNHHRLIGTDIGDAAGRRGVDLCPKSSGSSTTTTTTTSNKTTSNNNNNIRSCCTGSHSGSTSSRLYAERRWNFNEGQSPWGLKRNAEIWNGRVAQMAFVIVVLQELIQGKGVIQGLQEGDPVNLVCAGVFAVFVVAFTAFLAYKGDDDYVTRYLEENNLKR